MNITDEEFKKAAQSCQKEEMMVFPVDVHMRRFYNVYVTAPRTTKEEKIKELALDMILDTDGACLCDNEEAGIEQEDVTHMRVRSDDAWPLTDEDEFRKIFGRSVI